MRCCESVFGLWVYWCRLLDVVVILIGFGIDRIIVVVVGEVIEEWRWVCCFVDGLMSG